MTEKTLHGRLPAFTGPHRIPAAAGQRIAAEEPPGGHGSPAQPAMLGDGQGCVLRAGGLVGAAAAHRRKRMHGRPEHTLIAGKHGVDQPEPGGSGLSVLPGAHRCRAFAALPGAALPETFGPFVRGRRGSGVLIAPVASRCATVWKTDSSSRCSLGNATVAASGRGCRTTSVPGGSRCRAARAATRIRRFRRFRRTAPPSARGTVIPNRALKAGSGAETSGRDSRWR
jgi:hypothetical protein